jgi:hypothetical protein
MSQVYTLENSLIIHLFHFLATLKHLVFVSESFLLSHAPGHGWNMDLSLEKEGQKTIPMDLNQMVCMTKEELENSLIIHLFHLLATLKHLVFVSERFLLSHANHDLNQMVCMTKEEALRHENEVLKGGKKVEEVYDETLSLFLKAQIHVPPVTRSVPGDESQSVRQATDRTLPHMDLSLEKEGQKTIPMDLNQMVCMTKEEALRHENGPSGWSSVPLSQGSDPCSTRDQECARGREPVC